MLSYIILSSRNRVSGTNDASNVSCVDCGMLLIVQVM